MKDGWISVHRCLLDKPIWKNSTPEQRSVLIAILLLVDHQPNEWEWRGEKFSTNPGETVTSLSSIMKASGKGISIQNVRSSLKRFKKLEFLSNNSTKMGRVIKITNWDSYQVKETEPNKEATKAQQRGNKGPTPNNNGTMEQGNKKYKIKVSIPEGLILTEKMKDYCIEKSFTKKPELMFEEFIDYYKKHGIKYKDWEAAFRTWCRKDASFHANKKTEIDFNNL
jgi:hypothetical protein